MTIAATGTVRMLDAALEAVRLGFTVGQLCWPIFRDRVAVCGCGGGHQGRYVGKAPFAKTSPRGFHSFTNDPAEVEARWRRYPHANIGGYRAGLIVVDVDPRNGGDETAAALRGRYDWPETVRSIAAGNIAHRASVLSRAVGFQPYAAVSND